MTTPGTTTDAAASPVLGQQPDRDAGGADVAADPEAPTVETAEDESGEPLPQVMRYRDSSGRVHYASPYSKGTRDHVAASEWTELAADEPDAVEGPEPFDPTGALVREVVAHLVAHADDEAEVRRVKDAEAAGEDRPTIRDWTPDPQP